MSSKKDSKREFTPRKGQLATRHMVMACLASNKRIALAELPGGYGKSLAALMAFKAAKDAGYVDWCLYLAPGLAKIQDWDDDLEEDAEKIGLSITKPDGFVPVCYITGPFAFNELKEGNYNFFSCTIQRALRDDIGLIRNMVNERCFVIVDECHHYTMSNRSGNKLMSLNAGFVLGLSATPDHKTEEPLFNTLPEDQRTHVSLRAAYEEEAIRGVQVEDMAFLVDVQQNGEIYRLESGDLEQQLQDQGISLSEYEARTRLRYLDKYVSPIFLMAIEALDEKNADDIQNYIAANYGEAPPRNPNQMLVFASSVRQAKFCVNVFNMVKGAGFADYIGTGEDGREAERNKEILAKYKRGDLECLVQVSIAGEGFNNPPSSILVYLSLMHSGNKPYQDMLRGVRRNHKLIPDFENDYAIIFIPNDSKALQMAKDLEKLIPPIIDERTTDGEGGGGGQMDLFPIDIPGAEETVEIVDAMLVGATVDNIPEKRKREMKRQAQEIVLEKEPGLEPSYVMNIIERNFEDLLERKVKRRNKFLKRDLLQKEVDLAVGKIARRTAIFRHGDGNVNGQVIGDYKKAINSQYIRKVGRKTNKMTDDDLKGKQDWLRDLARQIGGPVPNLPKWLKM